MFGYMATSFGGQTTYVDFDVEFKAEDARHKPAVTTDRHQGIFLRTRYHNVTGIKMIKCSGTRTGMGHARANEVIVCLEGVGCG